MGARRSPGGPDGEDGEDGSATVYVVAIVVLLAAVTLLAAGFAGLAAAKHRAAAAADLAALAGASGDGCTVAAATARRNRARMTACVQHGADITVVVTVAADAPFGFSPQIRARARAGPQR